MTDPTHELDEIVVQGQRRRSDGTFPAGPGGGGPEEAAAAESIRTR